MTTNQTIDGVLVSRELIERILNRTRWHGDPLKDELRALLDAPIVERKPFGWFRTPKDCPLQGMFLHYDPVHGERDIQNALDFGFTVDRLYSSPAAQPRGEPVAFQGRVKPWMLECFGEAISADRQERNHRFLEEALELVQATGCTATEAHQLVDYVYGRPVGDPTQEVGGVMVTLAALSLANGMDMHAAGETELARIWTKVEQIRAKQAAKPAMSPLPGAYPDREQPAPVAVVPDGYCIMPRRLTAENGAKALLFGEFKLVATHECPECRELEEPIEGCEICDGEGEYAQQYTIPWDQIKFIYSKAVSGLALRNDSK